MTTNKPHSLDMNLLFHYGVTNRLAHLGQSSMIISILVSALVYFVFQGRVGSLFLNGWVAAILICALVRSLLIIQFWRMEISESTIRSWLRKYCAFVYASAGCWGVLPLLDVFQTSEWARAFLVFVVSGLSAGGMASLFPILRASIPYILIVLTPMLIVLARSEDIDQITMAVMCGFYIIMLVRSNYILNYNSNQAIRLEIENKELFNFLKRTRGVDADILKESAEWPSAAPSTQE